MEDMEDLRLDRGTKPNNWRIVDAAGKPRTNYMRFFDAQQMLRVMRLQGGAPPLVEPGRAGLYFNNATHRDAEVRMVESRPDGTCVVQFKVGGHTAIALREELSGHPRHAVRYHRRRGLGYTVGTACYRTLKELKRAFPYARLVEA